MSRSFPHPTVHTTRSIMAQPCYLRPAAAPLGRVAGLRHVHIRSSLIGDVCRQRGSTCVCESWLRPAPSRPAYSAYLSAEDIKAASSEHYWKIVNVGANLRLLCPVFVGSGLQGGGAPGSSWLNTDIPCPTTTAVMQTSTQKQAYGPV